MFVYHEQEGILCSLQSSRCSLLAIGLKVGWRLCKLSRDVVGYSPQICIYLLLHRSTPVGHILAMTGF
jgi:hypothetical protein